LTTHLPQNHVSPYEIDLWYRNSLPRVFFINRTLNYRNLTRYIMRRAFDVVGNRPQPIGGIMGSRVRDKQKEAKQHKRSHTSSARGGRGRLRCDCVYRTFGVHIRNILYLRRAGLPTLHIHRRPSCIFIWHIFTVVIR
jgi:hypothetical protein